VPVVDLHQHLWPEGFISALAGRTTVPYLRGSTVQLSEGEFELDLREHELERRIAALDRDGTELAVVSLQTTVGLDGLPTDERARLVGVWEEGTRELVAAAGGRLAALSGGGSVEGFVGAAVGSDRLADLDALAPLLDAIGRQGGFLFVHPSGGPIDAHPPWWSAVAVYPAQMQAAYLSWLAHGQARWPSLPVVFAILAGGAPFQLERLATRGVDVRSTLHSNVYLDTASYGRRALELCIETFGVAQLVYGSDIPVADPAPTLRAVLGFGESVAHMIRDANPTRLLQ
jgi:predicted TIM-barrel fold metal-dependent hydrolase